MTPWSRARTWPRTHRVTSSGTRTISPETIPTPTASRISWPMPSGRPGPWTICKSSGPRWQRPLRRQLIQWPTPSGRTFITSSNTARISRLGPGRRKSRLAGLGSRLFPAPFRSRFRTAGSRFRRLPRAAKVSFAWKCPTGDSRSPGLARRAYAWPVPDPNPR
jgi:hypothetical protein